MDDIDQVKDRLEPHGFMEAAGGYIECSCGWPNREQYMSGEHPALHVVLPLMADGWDIGYSRAMHDWLGDIEEADNPYRTEPL